MTDLLFVKGIEALMPYDQDAKDAIGKMKSGDVVRVKGVTRPRNPHHHRLYWAMLSKIVDNTDMFQDPEQLHYMLKIAIGHTRPFINSKGQVFYEPLPTDFASMDQTEFDNYFDRCVNVICARIIPGMDSAALKGELLEMVA